MATIHLVSHTHWDREWYQTFQQFRLRLVHLVDHLLALLETDPDYKHFMLDGQTIVLEDYLHMRPEREADLRRHIQSGRILIGPWYILPDEFLVSAESFVRNLLQGERICRQFGAKMEVGYIPDTFGHISMMPQILNGFGFQTACVWRGLGDEPCEFWWQSADGSRVLLANLRDSYSNGAGLPVTNAERFLHDICQARDSLAPHALTSLLLVMHGTDHMEPPVETSTAIARANQALEKDRLVHSTLPAYLAAVQDELQTTEKNIPTVTGEFRGCQRAPLLPGVLSTRIWIKQRNHACQTLLEKWAEPFSAWASLVKGAVSTLPAKQILGDSHLSNPAPILRQAWRLLLECHPHDSICGCSIDQVHDEMRPRFDQVEQIGEEITRQSLESLAAAVNTTPPESLEKCAAAVVVFNPTCGPRSDRAAIQVQLPEGCEAFDVVDDSGKALPYQVIGLGSQELFSAEMDRYDFKGGIGMVGDGQVMGMVIRAVTYQREGNKAIVQLILGEGGEADMAAFQRGMQQIENLLADASVTRYLVRARSADATSLVFSAGEAPGYGYRTYWIRQRQAAPKLPVTLKPLQRALIPLANRLLKWAPLQRMIEKRSKTARDAGSQPPYIIENELFSVEASAQDGALTVLDKRSNAVYRGLNRFVDGGDCGDEYNYCPPANDALIHQAVVEKVHIERSAVEQSLVLSLRLTVPAELSPDRKARSEKTTALPVVTRISLFAGAPRIDIQTTVNNTAKDHRLRVHFPAPFAAPTASFDGHFEIIQRAIGVPQGDESWVEQPRPETAQRAFTDLAGPEIGLLVANAGLPEAEALSGANGNSEIALTLLRCVGWLSRGDLSTRRGPAGPGMETPGAQMPGSHTFHYSIIPHQTGAGTPAARCAQRYHQAYAFTAPLRAVNAGIHTGSLPVKTSFVAPSTDDFALSAVKVAEDGRGWIVRGYNLSPDPIEVTLKPWKPFHRASLCNLAEVSQAVLPTTEDGAVKLTVKGKQTVSVRFE